MKLCGIVHAVMVGVNVAIVHADDKWRRRRFFEVRNAISICVERNYADAVIQCVGNVHVTHAVNADTGWEIECSPWSRSIAEARASRSRVRTDLAVWGNLPNSSCL